MPRRKMPRRSLHPSTRLHCPAGAAHPLRSASLTAVLTLTLAWAAEAQQPAPVMSPGQWLVDYGLRYGQVVTKPRPVDAEYVLTWMEAAARIAPDLAEANLWQYDLLSRLNREEEAYVALRAYCGKRPRDLSAALNLLNSEFERSQTVEERVAVCAARLQTEGVAPELASDAHRRLAGIRFRQGDEDEARAHAEKAVALFPQNLPAQTMLAEIAGRLDAPATQVDLLLREIAANPALPAPALRLAQLLDALSMHAAALTWYDVVARDLTRQNPEASPPTPLLLSQAWSHLDNHAEEQTVAICQQILAADPSVVEAELLLIHAARRLGRNEFADERAAALSARFREREVQALEEKSADVCHQIASIHLDAQKDVARALQFALLAAEYRPRDRDILRTLGTAQVEAGNFADAVKTLTPLAPSDQYASGALARAQIALGEVEAAKETLRNAEAIRYSGTAYERVIELLRELGETAAPPPDRGDVAAVLAGFDARVLEFPEQASELLQFDVRFESEYCPFDSPVRAYFRLLNQAPYPITLGQERMVNPHVAVSVRDTAHDGPRVDDFETVSLDERYVLSPGQELIVVRNLVLPEERLGFERQPQRKLTLAFSFVLDPVPSAEGKLVSALAGAAPVERLVTRLPLVATEEGIQELVQQLASESVPRRVTAIGGMMALIMERADAKHGEKHNYAATKVDQAALTEHVLAALKNPHPIARARAVLAMMRFPLSEEAVNAVAPLLSDPHWLPRLMAVEMLSMKQGPDFLPVLERMKDDPDATVAKLAKAYYEEAKAFIARSPKKSAGQQRSPGRR